MRKERKAKKRKNRGFSSEYEKESKRRKKTKMNHTLNFTHQFALDTLHITKEDETNVRVILQEYISISSFKRSTLQVLKKGKTAILYEGLKPKDGLPEKLFWIIIRRRVIEALRANYQRALREGVYVVSCVSVTIRNLSDGSVVYERECEWSSDKYDATSAKRFKDSIKNQGGDVCILAYPVQDVDRSNGNIPACCYFQYHMKLVNKKDRSDVLGYFHLDAKKKPQNKKVLYDGFHIEKNENEFNVLCKFVEKCTSPPPKTQQLPPQPSQPPQIQQPQQPRNGPMDFLNIMPFLYPLEKYMQPQQPQHQQRRPMDHLHYIVHQTQQQPSQPQRQKRRKRRRTGLMDSAQSIVAQPQQSHPPQQKQKREKRQRRPDVPFNLLIPTYLSLLHFVPPPPPPPSSSSSSSSSRTKREEGGFHESKNFMIQRPPENEKEEVQNDRMDEEQFASFESPSTTEEEEAFLDESIGIDMEDFIQSQDKVDEYSPF